MNPDIDARNIQNGVIESKFMLAGIAPYKIIFIAILIAVAVLFFDLMLPLGVAAGVPYVALVLMGLWFPNPRHIYVLAVIGTVLTVVGYVGSASGGVHWVVLTNRGLALFAIWVTAFVIASHKRVENLVYERNKELEVSGSNLRVSEERANAVVENILDGIIRLNEQGIIQATNPATEQIFGYSKEAMIGRNINMLMPEPYHSAHDGYLEKYRKTGQASIIGAGREVEGLRANGSIFPMSLQVVELWLGRERLFLGVVCDITVRKEVERMKSEFLSTVSHELRTPLTSIRGALSLISSGSLGALPEKVISMVELAEDNSVRMTTLVNDILDLAKLQSDQLAVEMEKLSLTDVVKDTIKANGPYANDYEVKFELIEHVDQAFVNGDSLRLAQVLTNLLSNAAKFSPKNGTVKVELSRRDNEYVVSVSDMGPGVPNAFHDHLFDRFTQADSTDTRKKGGTGLGLNISKAIVEKHGGSIGFNSEEGTGSSFFFTLPVLD